MNLSVYDDGPGDGRPNYGGITYATSSSGPFDPRLSPTYRPSNRTAAFFILDADGRTTVPCPDAARWRRWMTHSPLRVLKQEILKSGVRVSTVFVGVADCLWETEVTGGSAEHEAYMAYSTYAAAEAGHAAIVAELSRGTRGIRLR
jgi:hypothetical protein